MKMALFLNMKDSSIAVQKKQVLIHTSAFQSDGFKEKNPTHMSIFWSFFGGDTVSVHIICIGGCAFLPIFYKTYRIQYYSMK